jgi:hypothetical protein
MILKVAADEEDLLSDSDNEMQTDTLGMGADDDISLRDLQLKHIRRPCFCIEDHVYSETHMSMKETGTVTVSVSRLGHVTVSELLDLGLTKT